MKPTPIHPLYHLTFLTLFLLLLPLTSFAHDFEAINNGKTIYYNKISDTECEVTYYDNDVHGETYSGDITIPATVTYDGTTFSVTSIGDYAFCECTSLTSISIPNSLKSIGNDAFWYCRSLTTITLPNSITSIGEDAFHGCTSLTSISLPNSITSIGEFAFEGCTSFTSVTNLATTPQPISRNVFDGVPLSEATLYVPIGTKSLYASAKVWRDFGTITEIDASSISAVTPDGETTCDQIYTIDGRQISNQQNSSKASHPHTITIRHHSDGTISKQIIR